MIDGQRKRKLYILMLLNLLTNQTETEEDDTSNLSIELVVILYMMIVCIILSRRRLITREDRDPNDVVTHHMLRHHNLNRLITVSDIACLEQLRMDRHTFHVLCNMLRTEMGLCSSNDVSLEEMVAMFLHILGHHVKNRVIKFRFCRSGQTISKYFHYVLDGVIGLQHLLLATPEPVPETSTDLKWKWFKNCLGALDGTYIDVHVPEADQPRYRTRKGEICTNVLGVCSQNMQFIYTLVGWEGSAADSRVLRDAMRLDRTNRFNVPEGYYYLVDAGYPNANGFLAPYRSQKYHLSEWRTGHLPTSPEEFFNMKHAKARNVVERTFGLLKMRWACLRSATYYTIKNQGRIILACCLLHNLIRTQMSIDPLEAALDDPSNNVQVHGDPIPYVEVTNEWTNFRNNLANEMYDEWMESRA